MSKEGFKNRMNEDEGAEIEEFANGQNRRMVNRALIEFELCGRRHVVESENRISRVSVTVEQEKSCDFCLAGDVIEFKIIIKNDSEAELFNSDFRNILPRNTEFVRNSFKVNGKREDPTARGRSLSFCVNELKAHEELIITFDVEVF